jgi:hypothetical protein
MKQKIYILGLVSVLILFTGTIFKVNHWPAAGIMITAGMATFILLFLPSALINNYKAVGNSQNKSLYIVTGLTCFVVFTAMLFKIMHWPYAGIGLIVALPFPYIVFLPVFLVVTSKNKNFNIYNTVFVLLLMAVNSVFAALLALNVTKARVEDSYNLSRDFNKVETVLNQLPDKYQKSSVNLKIDGILKIVDEYQDLILQQEELTKEQWESNPGQLWRPEAPAIAGIALQKANELLPGEKLESGIKDLILEFGKTPGLEDLAKSAPAILNYKDPENNQDDWAHGVFVDNNLSWALIYLDALEVNLKMIRLSINTHS